MYYRKYRYLLYFLFILFKQENAVIKDKQLGILTVLGPQHWRIKWHAEFSRTEIKHMQHEATHNSH